jgi:hypothetical protein
MWLRERGCTTACRGGHYSAGRREPRVRRGSDRPAAGLSAAESRKVYAEARTALRSGRPLWTSQKNWAQPICAHWSSMSHKVAYPSTGRTKWPPPLQTWKQSVGSVEPSMTWQ